MQISISNAIGGISGTQGGGTPTPPPFSNVNSFSFDGVDNYFTGAGTYSELDGQSKMTFSAWIKAGSLSSTSYLFGIGGSTTLWQVAVRLQSLSTTDARCYFYINGGTNNQRSYANLGAIKNDGQWHHLMICMDLVNFSSFDEVDYFLDGNLLTTNGYYNPTSLVNAGTPLNIGNRENPNTGLMVGAVDEFAIWSGTDLRNDVATIYNNGTPTDLNNNGLTAPTTWFRMGEEATWNGFTWTMTDVNGGTTLRGANMQELSRTTDVPSASSFSNVNSFEFDGVDDYFLVPDTSGLSFGNGTTDSPFSISTWVKMTDATRFRVVGKLNGSNAEYAFFTSASDQLYIVLYDNNTSNRISRYTSSTLTSYEGTWIHLAATYNGSGNSSGLKIYLNNTRIDNTTSNVGAYTAMHNTSAPFEIGKYLTSSANGLIDEMAIFTTELSSSDVSAIYNNGEPQSLDTYSPFVWFRMGENATWNGATWTMTSVGTDTRIARSINMVEANRTTDVPSASSFTNTKSILLDGVDDYVDMGNVLNFERLDTFSISAWVKKNDNGSGMMIISKTETSGNYRGWMLYFDASNNLKFVLRRQNQSYNRLIATSTNSISANSWTHVLVTYDGSSTESGFNFYINGADAGSNGSGSTLGGGTSLATTIPLQIGTRNSSLNFLDGNIDEVSVFNTELSVSDVTSIYNGGVPNDISSLSPISWWRCGDGDTSPILTDNGSGGNDGTMTNFTTFSTDVPT